MRFISYSIFLFLLINCKSKKVDQQQSLWSEITQYKLERCNEDAQCSIEIIPNTNLILKQDEFQNSYVDFEKGDKLIVKYEFKRNQLPYTADGQHIELIYFEMDKNTEQLLLTDKELQSVKMVYGRLCYCKGTSGYFKVTNGHLKLINNNEKMTIDLDFKVGKIPQLLSEINETIKLKRN